MHAALDFAMHHPEEFKKWHSDSNYVCILAAKDEPHLLELSKLLGSIRKITMFREPDIGDELTAIAIAPHEGNKKLLSNLPLAGKAISK